MRFASTCRNRRHAQAARPLAAGVLSAVLVAIPGASEQVSEPSSAMGPAAPRTFRSAIELVALQVSVVDADGKYVAGLGEGDFGVYQDGAPQSIALFASARAPIDVMLLLDTSSSMTGRLDLAQNAAISFLRVLRPEDRAAIVLFNTNVRIAHALSSDRASLEMAVRDAMPYGGTALYQAVYIALRELASASRRADHVRRRALVVLTDGADNASSLTFDDALDEARRAAATIFAIVPALGYPRESLFRTVQRPILPKPFELRALTQETGGRTFMPGEQSDLTSTYRDVAEELSRQYWLGYVPPAAAAGFKRIFVRVQSRPGLNVRTRSGYYATETPRSRTAATRDGHRR